MAKRGYHYAYNVVIACFLVQMIMLFGLQGIPLLLPDVSASLQLSATAAGGLVATFMAFYGFLGFAWGFISDKIGPRKVFMLSLACVILGLFLFGLLGTSYASALILSCVVGIGCAAFTVATVPKLMSRWFTTKTRHLPSSIVMMGGVFCGMLQGLILPHVVAAVGWRGALMSLAGVALVFAIIIIAVIRDEPKDKGLLPRGVDEEDSRAAAAELEMAAQKSKEAKGLAQFVTVLKMGFTWKLIIHTIFYQMAYVAVNSFLPMAIMSAGYSRPQAGLVVTVYNLFQLLAMFAWGRFADKNEPKRALSYSLWVWTVGCIVLVFTYSTLTWAFLAIAITGLGLGAPGLMMSIMADYYPKEATGTGGGVSSTLGTFGRTLGPIVAGAIVDAAGGNFMYVFVFAAVMMVLSSVIPFTFGNVHAKEEAPADVALSRQ